MKQDHCVGLLVLALLCGLGSFVIIGIARLPVFVYMNLHWYQVLYHPIPGQEARELKHFKETFRKYPQDAEHDFFFPHLFYDFCTNLTRIQNLMRCLGYMWTTHWEDMYFNSTNTDARWNCGDRRLYVHHDISTNYVEDPRAGILGFNAEENTMFYLKPVAGVYLSECLRFRREGLK